VFCGAVFIRDMRSTIWEGLESFCSIEHQ
jgi:hypothetical protein